MPPLNRREFLIAGAGAVLLAACGSSGDDGAAPVKVNRPDKDKDKAMGKGGGAGKAAFNLVVASYVHVAGAEQRLALAFLDEEGTAPLKPEGPVKVTIDGRDVPATLYADGSLELPYLLVRHRSEKPGVAEVTATYKGSTAKAAVQFTDPAGVKMPLVGQPLPSVASPTVADPQGVDPICTRDPVCPLHEVGIDAALAEKRPLAVLFATPARCQSRLCGPVLDNLLAHREAFADRVRFVHVEVYASRTGNTLTPAMKAYGLAQEPFLFMAGRDGVVRERIDNAFDRTEARQALERLVAS